VTKTIRTEAGGETHASIEESEGGRTRKRSGKRAGGDEASKDDAIKGEL
jgi:hypothetical protein